MKRSEMREQAFFLTFESLFDSGENIENLIALYSENVEPVCDYAKEVFAGITEHKDSLNEIINKYSKSWKLSRLPKVTVAILYVAVYEINFVDTVPGGVAVNEAVELAKKYADKQDASYINGILGTYLKVDHSDVSRN